MEYHPTLIHNGHNFNEYIDDYDWNYLVATLTEYFKNNGYTSVEFTDEEFSDITWEIIDDYVSGVVYDLAQTDFGYKYGFSSSARKLVSDKLFEYFKNIL